MKKLFFLTALLCASVMGFAVDQDTWIPVNGAASAYANQFKWYELDGISTPSDVVEVQIPGFTTEIGIYVTFPDAAFDAVYFNDVLATDGTEYKQQGAGLAIHVSALTMKNTTIVLKQGATNRFGLRIYNDKGTSSGDEKLNPELSLNQTEVTLSAEAPAGTFQIVPTQSGDGAISYESDKPGIASVSDGGLVTAVGRGTAIITVRSAETATYEAAIKKLTVTVTGPINWNSVEWLGNGTGDATYTNKFKAVASPAGMTINNLQNNADKNCIHVICPSAVFGACSLAASDYHTEGAGLFLHLDAFTAQETQFTLVCNSTTYTFDVYYAGTTTAITNTEVEAKAVKVFENGQLVIIKNGVKYNALGAELR